MLTEIRDRSSGWFAWVIAVLIIVPMAFWGIQEYASTSASPTLFEVGETKISQADFESRLSQEQQRFQQQLGEQASLEFLNSEVFKQNVLQQMINRAVVEKLASDSNYRVSDKQLIDIIKNEEVFKVDGKFDPESYERYVQQSFYSKAQFEDRIRAQSRLSQVASGYSESAFVLPDESSRILALMAEQRQFDLVSVKQSDYLDKVTVEESEIDAYFADNSSQFMTDEKVSIDFLELKITDIEQQIELSDDELEVVYEENIESFTTPEQRTASHILLAVKSSASDAEKAEKLTEAKSLVTQLNEGADFAELATANSDDPGSVTNGGALGVIEPGQMVPEFEQAVFALSKGEITEPVETQFGYHIIKLDELEASKQQSFAEAKAKIAQQERARLAEEQLLEKLEILKNLTYEQPDTLGPAAEELGLTLQQSEPFSRQTGEGVGAIATVRTLAFSEEVFVDGINSEPTEIAEGEYLVLRKGEHFPSVVRELDEVKAGIETTIKADKAAELAKQTGDELLQQAEQDWQNVVGDAALSVETHTVSLADQQATLSADLVQHVGKLQMNSDQPEVSSLTSANGDFHIVRLTDIKAGNVAELSAQLKESTRRLLRGRNGGSLFSSYLDAVLEQEEVSVDNSLL